MASMKQAMNFVESKIEWIIKAQSQTKAQEKKNAVFTPETVFSTQKRHLKLLPWKSGQFRAQLSKDALTIFYPQDIDLLSNQAQKTINDYIISAIRQEAKDYLPQRTKQLAEQYGFVHNGVTVKNLTSRWGSCSATNHINLNIHLVRLPEHLSDYVILHELSHTIHKNHGEHFWQTLNKITGGKAKRWVAEMKKYNVSRLIG